MNSKPLSGCFMIFFVLVFCQKSFGSLTLESSYFSALKNNQGEVINQSLINQNLELKKQGQSNYFPKVSARGTYQIIENINDDGRALGLNLIHSIYKGGRDSLTVNSAEKNIVIAENQKTVDRLNLYMNVIQAYYNYFLNQNDYKNIELLKKQSIERVDETKKRVQVGRSRKGELFQAEAQLASTDAQLLNGVGLVKESEDRFYLLTGLDKSNNIFSEIIQIPSSDNERGMSSYLEAAYARADVKNRELKVDLANIDISQSKSFYYPTLDLASNYYFNKRTGTLHDSNWDVGFVLSFPLYEGGVTKSKVNESVEKKDQALFTLLDYKKTILLDITSRYETYHRYRDQIRAFDQALEKTKRSYDETLKDYRLGLVSNLDVLSSLNLYLDSKRNSEKTKIQAMMNLKMLEAASGVLP
jgi:outer membrane protein